MTKPINGTDMPSRIGEAIGSVIAGAIIFILVYAVVGTLFHL